MNTISVAHTASAILDSLTIVSQATARAVSPPSPQWSWSLFVQVISALATLGAVGVAAIAARKTRADVARTLRELERIDLHIHCLPVDKSGCLKLETTNLSQRHVIVDSVSLCFRYPSLATSLGDEYDTQEHLNLLIKAGTTAIVSGPCTWDFVKWARTNKTAVEFLEKGPNFCFYTEVRVVVRMLNREGVSNDALSQWFPVVFELDTRKGNDDEFQALRVSFVA